MIKLYFTTLLWVCAISVQAQQITNIRAELNKLKRVVSITYNLDAQDKEHFQQFFEVQVFVSLDSGLTYSPPLESLRGETKKVRTGIGNQLFWNYYNEMPDFSGDKIVFKITGKLNLQEEEKRLSKLGTSSSAFQSLLLPGTGSSKVNGKKPRWWIGATAYGLVGSGIYFKLNADQQYKEYQIVRSPELAAEALSKARNQQNIARICIASGAAIWAGDVLYTLIKGSKNEKKIKELRERSQNTPRLSLQWQGTGGALLVKF